MNHQYFKEWLLTEEALSTEQKHMLDDHIKGCSDCQRLRSAWFDVHHLIKVTPDIHPFPGFTSRWESRLIQQRKQTQKRLTWIVFAGLLVIAFLISIVLGLQVSEFFHSPQQLILSFLSRLAVLISYLTVTKDYFNFLSLAITKISFPLMVFSSGLMTLFCVLWLAAMKQISSVWRIAK